VHISDLPALNAALNATSACLLSAGYVFMMKRRIPAHRACMIAAFTTSCAFLASYLVYHAHVGSKPFPGHGPARLLYFAILISHVLLAAVIVPLALVTLRRGLRMDVARHRRIARWTWPLWMYVSVTGVVIYVMLYRIY
jgi:putative membrane protein